MSFKFHELEIPGAYLIEASRFEDGRGFFQEVFKRSAFEAEGLPVDFVQENAARSRRGALRGLHFQVPPQAQGKLVTVTRGAVLDVGVDLREGSPTFKEWVGVELSEDAPRLLYLPPGLAHGYLALTDEAHLMYRVTSEYAPALEGGIRWDDPEIGIAWPSHDPILSEKDLNLPLLAEAPSLFRYPTREEETP